MAKNYLKKMITPKFLKNNHHKYFNKNKNFRKT